MARARRVLSSSAHRALRLVHHPPPTLSVIIPSFDSAAYIANTLDSVTDQSLRDIEIIVVDDGSRDTTRRIVRRKALGDDRIRLFRRVNAGPGPAREFGIAQARGKYLAFVDSDDLLPAQAMQMLVRAAESDRSEIAVGAFRRFDSSRVWVAPWVGEIHRTDSHGVALDELPQLLRNNYPPGKVYLRDYWLAQNLHFRAGAIYEDQPLIALMLLRAKRLSVITDIVYDYRARDDRSSISQRPEEMRDLRDRISAWMLTRDALECEKAPLAVVRAWYGTLFATHVHWYLDNDAIVDPEYWGTLHDAFTDLAATAPSGSFETATAERRAALWVLSEADAATSAQFRQDGGYNSASRFESSSTEGLHYRFDDYDVPAAACVTARSEVRVAHALFGAEVVEQGESITISIDGRVGLIGVPAGLAELDVAVRLDSTTHDRSIPARIERDVNRVDDNLSMSFEMEPEAGASDEFVLVATVSLGGLAIEQKVGNAELTWLAGTSRHVHTPSGICIEFIADANPHVPLRIRVEFAKV